MQSLCVAWEAWEEQGQCMWHLPVYPHTHQQNVLCLCVCATQLRMQRSLDVAFTFDSQLEAAFQGLSRRLSATTKG